MWARLLQNVRVTVIVGVDGSGRTHRLEAIANATGRSVIRVTRADSAADVSARLDQARADGLLVAADDAHRLSDEVLDALTGAALQGVPTAITRRPTLNRESLAALDEAVARAGGSVESLEPLAEAELSVLIRTVRGTSPDRVESERIMAASGGLPAIAAAMASAPSGPERGDVAIPALVARIQQRLALAGGAARSVCRVLALDIDLTDAVLCRSAGIDRDELAVSLRELRDAGLVGLDGHHLVPAVATVVKSELSPAELRRVHGDVADALLESGAEPLTTAAQLRAARVRTPAAAQVFAQAGEQLRLTDPEAALAWYDDAAEAGAEPAQLSAGRTEAAALLGRTADIGAGAVEPGSGMEGGNTSADTRLALVAGAVEMHNGRARRAIDALLPAGPVGQILAVPVLVALGQLERAREIAHVAERDKAGDVSLRRFAEAAVAVADPSSSVPLFIEAAEVLERSAPAVVLPDTPHALGAIVAVGAADVATAERLLASALETGVGGPVALERHRLLLGWVRMRAGRYDTAQEGLRSTDGRPLMGREWLLRASLAAGIARRSGDVAALRDAWELAEPMLVRGGVDLFTLECAEELVVTAARLAKPQRAQPVFAALETIVEDLGKPPAWASALGWARVQFAVAGDDVGAARRAVDDFELDEHGATQRVAAFAAAAAVWKDLLNGSVDRQAVLTGTDLLDAAGLPWEASRLAGQAAIRSTNPADARLLLERARAFTQQSSESSSGHLVAQRKPASVEPPGRLSSREVEVARLVLAGRTHKEIGAQLYLSPKTVEHHVARIRTKLGVRTREEFVAALRDILGD